MIFELDQMILIIGTRKDSPACMVVAATNIGLGPGVLSVGEVGNCFVVDRLTVRAVRGSQMRRHIAAAGVLSFGVWRNHSHISGDL
jgi:hypothetical protein